MFKEPVISTAFSTPYADSALGFVKNMAYGEDRSLESTLRALLVNRIPKDHQIFGWWQSMNYDATTMRNANKRNIFDVIYRNCNLDFGMFNICSLETGDNDKAFEAIEEYMVSDTRMAGFTKIEKITAFFRKSFRTLCYINNEKRGVFLFIEKLDNRKLHFVQCSITAMLPWYFPPEEKLNDDEMRLVKSLTKDSIDEYLESIEAIIKNNGIDFRKLGIEKLLDGFEAKIYRTKGRTLKRSIEELNDRIERLKNEIMELVSRREERLASMFGYENMADKAESNEMLEYFLANKFVDLAEVRDDGTMTFVPFGYLTFWNEAEAKELIDYSRSYVYIEGVGYSHEDRKLLTTAIFLDKKLKLRMCSAYTLSISDRSVYGQNGYMYPSAYETYLPNPHIDRYHCLGSNESVIVELLEAGDYTSAVDQCIVSSRSLNMHDGAVMSAFFRKLFSSSNNRYIEAPDGTLMSVTEAIEYLKKEG